MPFQETSGPLSLCHHFTATAVVQFCLLPMFSSLETMFGWLVVKCRGIFLRKHAVHAVPFDWKTRFSLVFERLTCCTKNQLTTTHKPKGWPCQGKPTNVDFQNPFMEPVEFSLQVDDPSFQLTQRAFKLDGKKSVTRSGNYPFKWLDWWKPVVDRMMQYCTCEWLDIMQALQGALMIQEMERLQCAFGFVKNVKSVTQMH